MKSNDPDELPPPDDDEPSILNDDDSLNLGDADSAVLGADSSLDVIGADSAVLDPEELPILDESAYHPHVTPNTTTDNDLPVGVIISLIAGGLAVASLFGSFGLAVRQPREVIRYEAPDDRVQDAIGTLQGEQLDLQARVTLIEKWLETATEANTETNVAVQIAEVRSKAESISDRLLQLEGAIVDSPAKALSLPLLRKDIEDLRRDFEEGRASTALAIDRAYDFNKWFIGIMVTTALAVIGIVVNSLLQARKGSSVDVGGKSERS